MLESRGGVIRSSFRSASTARPWTWSVSTRNPRWWRRAGEEEPRCVVHDVPDDLLRLILLRLGSPLWLFRAACACKRWRRIVDGDDRGRAFLRLASSLHPPAVVGHYQNNVGGGRRFVPSSSLPAPSCFSLDFIPKNVVTGTTEHWQVADCHGGLVLLREGIGFPSDLIIICDPLTRRYRRIHRPPGHGSWRSSPGVAAGYYSANIFLIDGDDGNISVSNFRVLYRSDDDDDEYIGSQLYMFSMADGGDFGNWRVLRRSQLDDRYRDGFGRVAGRVDGSLYLGLHAGVVTVLDKDKLEFSKVDLPPIRRDDGERSTFAVVNTGAAAAGTDPTTSPPSSPPVVCIVHVHGQTLELFRRRQVVHGTGEWVLEHSIPKLSRETRRLPGYPDHKRFWWQTVEVIAGGTGFAILSAWVSDRGRSMTWLFSFNVDTMELQPVTNEAAYCGKTMASTYTMPWPRFLRAARRPLLKPKSTSPIKANPPIFQFLEASYPRACSTKVSRYYL